MVYVEVEVRDVLLLIHFLRHKLRWHWIDIYRSATAAVRTDRIEWVSRILISTRYSRIRRHRLDGIIITQDKHRIYSTHTRGCLKLPINELTTCRTDINGVYELCAVTINIHWASGANQRARGQVQTGFAATCNRGIGKSREEAVIPSLQPTSCYNSTPCLSLTLPHHGRNVDDPAGLLPVHVQGRYLRRESVKLEEH